jgi:hypothetical protein
MLLKKYEVMTQTNPTPPALAKLIQTRKRLTLRCYHDDLEAAARVEWWAAQLAGGDLKHCLSAADKAMTAVRQPRGSRLGPRRPPDVTAAPRPSPPIRLDHVVDEQAEADRPREILEGGWDHEVLASLLGDERVVVELLIVGGETYATVAKKLNVTVHRVRVLEARAIITLQQRVAALHDEGRVECSKVTQAGLALLRWLNLELDSGVIDIPPDWDIVTSNGREEIKRRKKPFRGVRWRVHMSQEEADQIDAYIEAQIAADAAKQQRVRAATAEPNLIEPNRTTDAPAADVPCRTHLHTGGGVAAAHQRRTPN